ncbi:MAG: cryptochrome/photolyase family protein [Minwuia sp.]|uniref:cryptochrome/photolyase family protein n=1 Tax=Minwuia sp. TaxID=2493630 RepID=UPI003A8A2482
MSQSPVICWFRRDLRLADNPALTAAAGTGRPVICLYVLDDETPGEWRMGGASRWWLHNALEALATDLHKRNNRLILRRGRADEVLDDVIDESGAEAVYWNRLYDPAEIERDKRIKAALKDRGLMAESCRGNLGFEPWTIRTGSGDPYKVFSPFLKACLAADPPAAPLPAPEGIGVPGDWPASEDLDSWGLLPTKPDWAGGLRDSWTPGEAGAADRLESFLAGDLDDYAKGRNYPDRDVTSRLSPHLHFGEISVNQIWQRIDFAEKDGAKSVGKFRSEVVWREFSHHLLFHFPDLPENNWRRKFDDFPWREDSDALTAWQKGRTGYPMVDAGMRELWHTGYMHNRVRMIAASFLIKHLLLHWRHGEDWFWDTLVDADLANNSASWQWVAGSGADAAPYFRIFNPIKQGQDYDPKGVYIRRWVPEIAGLPDKHLHAPWEAPAEVLKVARVELDRDYPRPIVDHPAARRRALDAFEAIKGS